MRVDDGHADTMQAAGDLVAFIVELAAGMQFGHHDFRSGTLFLVVVLDVDGNAAAVVLHADRVVGVDDDLDVVAIAGESLVDRIVDDLEHHMVEPGSIRGVTDVHTRPLANGLEAFQYLDAV